MLITEDKRQLQQLNLTGANMDWSRCALTVLLIGIV